MGADNTTSVWTLGETTSGKCFCIQRNEASNTQADVDATKTGGMFLRITQIVKVCTVDASVAESARDVRSVKCGHYFHQPLVPGSHLLGEWVWPERVQKIWILGEMTSEKMFLHPAQSLA